MTVAQLPQKNPLTVSPDLDIATAIKIMEKEGFDQIPVVDASGYVAGHP